ncbi:MAG TPA: PAS domain S-box protein, partial [Ktedonobacterales bacterium]
MTDGVFVTDKEGNTVRSNQAFRHLLGIDLLPTPTSIPAHARGSLMDVRDAQGQPVPPDQMPTARILRGEALQGSSAQDVTLRALDGRIVEANVTGAPVRTTDGGIVGAVAVYRDVTKRRQLERQVTEQASQLEGIFETMADGLVVFDAYGRILRENAADFAMFGFDRAEAGSPRTLIERGQLLALRDEHGRMLPHMQWPTFRVLRGEELHGNEAVELKAHTADGRELQISESAAPIRDKAGHIVGGVLVIRDVTARRKLENQTRDALQSLLGMAEALVSPENAVGASTPYEASLVMRRLAELTRSLLGCQRVSFTTLDEEMERIRPILRVGAPLKQEPCGDAHKEGFHRSDYLPTALIERLRAGEVVAHDVDVAAASAHAGAGQAARRVLFAPMRINWRLIGLLGLEYGEQSRQFTADERALAGAVAQLAAVVLERERLVYEREEAHAGESASREATRRMELFMAMASHEFRTPLTVINRYLQLGQQSLDSSLPAGEPDTPIRQALLTAQEYMKV